MKNQDDLEFKFSIAAFFKYSAKISCCFAFVIPKNEAIVSLARRKDYMLNGILSSLPYVKYVLLLLAAFTKAGCGLPPESWPSVEALIEALSSSAALRSCSSILAAIS